MNEKAVTDSVTGQVSEVLRLLSESRNILRAVVGMDEETKCAAIGEGPRIGVIRDDLNRAIENAAAIRKQVGWLEEQIG